MQRNFPLEETLKDLFPPGVLSDDEVAAISLLKVSSKEFKIILDAMNELTSQQNLGVLGITSSHLNQKGQVVEAYGKTFHVSNTLDHLKSLGAFSITADTNSLYVSGVRNKMIRTRSGFRCKKMLAKFDRDLETQNKIESIKQAHVLTKYEVEYA